MTSSRRKINLSSNLAAQEILKGMGFVKIYSRLEESRSSLKIADIKTSSYVGWSIWKNRDIFVLLTSRSRKREEKEGLVYRAYLYVKAPSVSMIKDIEEQSARDLKEQLKMEGLDEKQFTFSEKDHSLGSNVYEIEDFYFADIEKYLQIGMPFEKEDYFKMKLFPFTKRTNNIKKREKFSEILQKVC